MKAFAIIRHAKIKAGRHLVSTGKHNARGIPTPNAEPDAPEKVEILIGSAKPWRDVANGLKAMKICKIKSDGVVAVEQLSSASPEWWASKGWVAGKALSPETRAVIDAWTKAEVALARKKYGHLLVSAVLHLDEASPHLHCLILPCQYRLDGREKGENKGRLAWRMSAEQMIMGPAHLRQIVTEHAKAMASFGLVRGETHDPGTVEHKTNKQWQIEQAALGQQIGELVMEQGRIRDQASEAATALIEDARRQAARIVADAEKKAKEQAEFEVVAEAERRRKADDAHALQVRVEAARLQVLRDREAIKVERQALVTMRGRLEGLLKKAEALLRPIMTVADQWRRANPLVRAAMGTKGPEAVKIVESVEVQTLMALRRGQGSSR